jgi:O-antigen/teichoic acid export membrane protein
VLTLYRGLDDVGVYSIAMQAAESMWLVPAAIATALTAPVVHEDERDAVRLVERATLRALLLTAAVAVVVGIAARWVIPLLLGDAFRHAATPLALLLPGVVVYAPVTILVLYLSVRCERPSTSLASAVVAGAVTLGAAFALVPGHGASGAAVASSLGYAAGALAAWLAFVRLRRARR